MKKYVTFVKDEEESRKVQEALFKVGFGWKYSDGVSPKYASNNFLHINYQGKGSIARSLSFTSAMNGIGEEVPIEAETIIADPFQLDGATQPEKMIEVDGKEYSASTIKAALQEYVK